MCSSPSCCSSPGPAVLTAAPGENNFICEGTIFGLVVACFYSIFFSSESQMSTFVSLLFLLLVLLLLLFLLLCYIEMFFLHCIGSIGAATFYSAAVSRLQPHAQPGGFHAIFHLRLVSLVFGNSFIILT